MEKTTLCCIFVITKAVEVPNKINRYIKKITMKNLNRGTDKVLRQTGLNNILLPSTKEELTNYIKEVFETTKENKESFNKGLKVRMKSLNQSFLNLNNSEESENIELEKENILNELESIRNTPFNEDNKLRIEKLAIRLTELNYQETERCTFIDRMSLPISIYPTTTTVIDSMFVSQDIANQQTTNIAFNQFIPMLQSHKNSEMMIYSNDINKRSKVTFDNSVLTDYRGWNGLLVIDIDLKNDPSFKFGITPEQQIEKTKEYIENLKRDMGHLHWVLAIKPSNSDKGIHIYTKVTKPFFNHSNEQGQRNSNDFFNHFAFNYFHKHSIVYYLLEQYGVDLKAEQRGETYTDVNGKIKKYGEVVDLHTLSITQGIRLAPKASTFINAGRFYDEYYQVTLNDKPIFNGVEVDYNEYLLSNEYIMNEMFELIAKENLLNNKNQTESTKAFTKYNELHELNIDLENGGKFDMANIQNRYDLRWKTVNTICSLIDDRNKAQEVCFHLLDVEGGYSDPKELNNMISTAFGSHKKPNKAILNMITKKGHKVEKKENVTKEEVKETGLQVIKHEILSQIDNVYNMKNGYTVDHIIKLEQGEYISDKSKEIKSYLDSNKINYIEAFAGTGKTHYFKSLSQNEKVCLILPYTSIIDSKICSDELFNQNFDIYMGEDKPTKDIDGSRNVCMTFDKFSNMTIEQVSLFSSVVIDEAHLLFSSDYRLEVCSSILDKLIDIKEQKEFDNEVSSINIDGFLLPTVNQFDDISKYTTQTNIILMSGTPMGEINYLNNTKALNHIKIESIKKHNNNANIIIVPDHEAKMTHLVQTLVNNINKGVKNIIITNKGFNFSEPLVKTVESLINREVKSTYFKRSMKENNENMNIMYKGKLDQDIDILFGSSYLSVGVDIENTNKFNVFFPFNEHTAEDIEQFNNRLRKTNIESFIYQIGLEPDGSIKNLYGEFLTENKPKYELTEDVVNDDRKLQELSDNMETDFLCVKSLFHKYGKSGETIKSEALKALFEYNQTIGANKNILYIYNQLAKKYQYNVEVNVFDNNNDLVNSTMKAYKKCFSDEKNDLLRQFILDFYKVNNHKDLKLKDYIFSSVSNIEVKEDKVLVPTEYKDFFTDILPIAKHIKEVYSLKTAETLTCMYESKNALKNLNRLIKIKSNEVKDENKTITNEVKDIILDSLDNSNMIVFTPNVEVSKKEKRELSKEMKEEYINSLANTFINKTEVNNDLHTDKTINEIEKAINILFTQKYQKGSIILELNTIPEFDSEQYEDINENDSVIDDVFGSVEKEKDQLSTKITKTKKDVVVIKKLGKKAIKQHGQMKYNDLVKLIKADFFKQTGMKLTARQFKSEYVSLFKRKGSDMILLSVK